MAIGYGCAQPKPEPRAKTKRREDRLQADHDAKVRAFVFARERDLCRVCRIRAAESRHELIARSLGGKVSQRNCIAVCGQIVGAVPSCHTFLQSHAIHWQDYCGAGAVDTLWFTPTTQEAADWLHVKVGQTIESAPMRCYEVNE